MDPLPAVHRRPGLPDSVTVYEVGPRDGLQAENTVVPLEIKLELINRLGDAGRGDRGNQLRLPTLGSAAS